MDTVKTLFFWPLHASKSCLTTVIGFAILALPLLFRLVTKGRKGFANNIDTFAFMCQFPLGSHCFSTLIPLTAPYSGSVEAHITNLSRTKDTITCSGTIQNLPWLRNPFQSVHAVALTNLGEVVSGIGMLTAFQCDQGKGVRGIPIKISTEYFKKAKGAVIASSSIDLSRLVPGTDMVLETVLSNEGGEEVARCSVMWTLSAKGAKKRD